LQILSSGLPVPDPSFIIPLFLQSALLPFTTALIISASLRERPIATAIAAAGGFLAAYIAVFHAQWSFPPKQALDWLPWMLLAALGLAAAADRMPGLPRQFILLAASIGAAWSVAWPAIASGAVSNATLPIIVAGMGIYAAWSYLARAAERRATPGILLAVVAGGAALTMMLDVSALLGQLAGGLASALLACFVIGILGKGGRFSSMAAGTASLLLGMLLFHAYLYAGFPAPYIALLACGILADGASAILDRIRKSNAGFGSVVTAALLALMPIAIAVGLAFKTAQESGGY
jgi:hypothetical protein